MTNDNADAARESFPLFRETLAKRYGNTVYRTWFSDLELDDAKADSITLSTESDLRRDRLDQQFKLGLRETWSETVYPIRRVLIVKRHLSAHASRVNGLAPSAAPTLFGDLPAAKDMRPAANGKAKANGRSDRWEPTLEEIVTPIDPRMTFETFAVDDTNGVAHAAARQIFMTDAARDILYVYGQSGVGKSHLLQACANEWLKRRPGGKAAYLTHNNIQSGCVGALLSNSTLNLQRDFLSSDLVMIDDIHLLAGKKRTLEEVLNLINALTSARRQVIVAGELPPSALAKEGVNDRLADRLAGGLAVRIAPGGESLRFDVLRKHRDGAGLRCAIPDETLRLVARLFGSSMRECIGALKQLMLVYRDQAVEVGPNEAMAALQARLGDRKRKASLEETLAATATAFNLNPDEIRGRAQPQRIARARHAFVYVARTVLSESFPRIARALGRDHTTAISSLRRAEALITRDKAFLAAVNAIKIAIGVEIALNQAGLSRV
ncbi:MAG: ATP-binding protein [Parvularculaceae bacterium]|nr:ATP-binding protein [Parvularculaceae bacterium]